MRRNFRPLCTLELPGELYSVQEPSLVLGHYESDFGAKICRALERESGRGE